MAVLSTSEDPNFSLFETLDFPRYLLKEYKRNPNSLLSDDIRPQILLFYGGDLRAAESMMYHQGMPEDEADQFEMMFKALEEREREHKKKTEAIFQEYLRDPKKMEDVRAANDPNFELFFSLDFPRYLLEEYKRNPDFLLSDNVRPQILFYYEDMSAAEGRMEELGMPAEEILRFDKVIEDLEREERERKQKIAERRALSFGKFGTSRPLEHWEVKGVGLGLPGYKIPRKKKKPSYVLSLSPSELATYKPKKRSERREYEWKGDESKRFLDKLDLLGKQNWTEQQAATCFHRIPTRSVWLAVLSCIIEKGHLSLSEAARLVSTYYAMIKKIAQQRDLHIEQWIELELNAASKLILYMEKQEQNRQKDMLLKVFASKKKPSLEDLLPFPERVLY